MKGLYTVSNTVCTNKFNKHFNTRSPTKANIASKKKTNKNEIFGPNVLEIFHHSADFGTCHLCFFFSLQAQAAVTKNTAYRRDFYRSSSPGQAVFTGIKYSPGVCITLYSSPLLLPPEPRSQPSFQSPGPQGVL